ncbi:hypothetical protein PG985_011384 [Apiospora marii]|uniref:uncharacterized protein n=1 Tax=Apiospora marii TaxID=335849 RepID=UPI00312D41A9
MNGEAESTPPLVDYATFSTSVEVRQSLPGRGFGLFTKQAVSVGELLLCEKALAYEWSGEEPEDRRYPPGRLLFSDTRTGFFGGQARLLTQLVQKLRRNPETYHQFQQLYRGEYEGVPQLVVDGQPVVDTFHVAKVIALSGMGAPRSSQLVYDRRDSPRRSAYHACGVWALASRINHCCLANCRRSFIGDMLIVRATQDLTAGTELLFSYCDTPGGTPEIGPDVQQKLMRTWGFMCRCALCCTYREASPEPLLVEPSQRLRELGCLIYDPNFFVGEGVLAGFKPILRQLEEVGGVKDLIARLVAAPVPHFEMADFCVELAAYQSHVLEPSAALVNFLRGLKLLGFQITAYPVGAERAVSVQTPLVITSWGVANETALRAVTGLVGLYGRLHPGLVPAMRGYGRRLYSMIVGQEATAASDCWRLSFAYKHVPHIAHERIAGKARNM